MTPGRVGSVEASSSPASAGVLAAGGILLLLVRPVLLEAPAPGPLLASTYLLLGAASRAAAVPVGGRRSLAPGVALAVGLGAVATGALVAGPPVPVARSGWALTLGSLAAVAEEAFFRRFLYGWLARRGAAVAVGVAALAFALVHLPAYGPGALWVDLGAGLLLSWQRWSTGGWGVPAATHVAANLVGILR